MAAWTVLRSGLSAAGISAVAGHSVGEYAALAAAEVVSIEDGARLVQIRGNLMNASGKVHPGTMAAVLGLGREETEAVCAEAEGVVVLANDNCPGQLVISGEVDAVKRAGELASQKGAKRVLPLNVAGAFHSRSWSNLQKKWAGTCKSYFSGWKSAGLLQRHFRARSRCRSVAKLIRSSAQESRSLDRECPNMRRDGIETFVECGVGEVLSGLLRRIDKEATGA